MIRGQKSPVLKKEGGAKVCLPLKLHNRFDFEVRDSVTGELKQLAYAENIILDQYWTRIFTPGSLASYIHIGTGTGTPSASRTSLFTYLANKAVGSDTLTRNKTEGWVSFKRSATWSEAENQNTAWTEVGLASSTTSTALCTHALIKDQNGNPATISKGTTDIITVYSTVYVYYPTAWFDSGKISFPDADGMTNSIFSWAAGRNQQPLKYTQIYSEGSLNTPMTGNITGQHVSSSTENTISGNASTKKLTVTLPRLAAGSGNYTGGIKSVGIGGGDSLQSMLVKIPCTAYPYSTITAESIGTGDGSTTDFSTDFWFVKDDSSFVLCKNGVALTYGTDYTVDFGIPLRADGDLSPYFNIIDQGYYKMSPAQEGYFTPTGDKTKDYCVFENPFYATYGINSLYISGARMYTSDDLATWTLVSETYSGTITVPAGHQNKRYWKMVSYPDNTTNGTYSYDYICTALVNKKNIHFVTAPAQGDTITADYRAEVIAKDANHVFDLTVEITLQEKTT